MERIVGHLDELPDAERLVADILRARLGGDPVSTELPTSPTWPRTTVTRVGGGYSHNMGADRARLQLDFWGSTKGEASALARRALPILYGAVGDYGTYSILAVENDTGLLWLPDTSTTPNRPRYVAGVFVTIR